MFWALVCEYTRFYLGLTLISVLIPRGARGTIDSARDLTQVSHMQSRHPAIVLSLWP